MISALGFGLHSKGQHCLYRLSNIERDTLRFQYALAIKGKFPRDGDL